MGQRRNDQEQGLTAEEAARRIEQLRDVYNQGYMKRDLFEALKREIEARVRAGSG